MEPIIHKPLGHATDPLYSTFEIYMSKIPKWPDPLPPWLDIIIERYPGEWYRSKAYGDWMRENIKSSPLGLFNVLASIDSD